MQFVAKVICGCEMMLLVLQPRGQMYKQCAWRCNHGTKSLQSVIRIEQTVPK